jgi:hypothetical protein
MGIEVSKQEVASIQIFSQEKVLECTIICQAEL